MPDQRTVSQTASRPETGAESTLTGAGELAPLDLQVTPAPPLPTIPRYTILKQIGRGGMGFVYEAIAPIGTHVALKIIHPRKNHPNLLVRFRQEARAMMELEHPNLARIYDYGEHDTGPYFTMKLLSGRTLADLLPELNQQPERAIQLAIRIAAAVGYMHSRKKVHRDLKPNNVLLDDQDEPFVSDFGLIKDIGSAELASESSEQLAAGTPAQGHSSTLTHAGDRLGTAAYMSPEQASGELDRIGPPSDVWSLGVMIHELVWGTRPEFDENQKVEFSNWAGESSGELESGIQRIVTKCLANDPADRYATGIELKDDLAALVSRRISTSHSPRNFARKAVLIGAGLLACVGIAAVASNGFRRDEARGTIQPFVELPAVETFQRERPLDTPIRLLRDDHQPLQQRVLAGEGKLNALPTELVMRGDGDQPFFLALDRIQHPAFEFTAEMSADGQLVDRVNDLGMFFGWRENLDDPMDQMRFFSMKLDTRKVLNDLNGRLYLGTWQFNPPKGAAAIHEQDLRLLAKGRGWIPLVEPLKLKAVNWHQVRITVRDRQFTLELDGGPTEIFDLATLTQTDRWLAPFSLECHGMLGIWVRNGSGRFRNLTTTTLKTVKD